MPETWVRNQGFTAKNAALHHLDTTVRLCMHRCISTAYVISVDQYTLTGPYLSRALKWS